MGPCQFGTRCVPNFIFGKRYALKSLRKFLDVNEGIRKIIVTTKTKLGSVNIDGNTFLFIPSALYAYWVSKYLFEEKTNKILLPDA